MGHLDKILIKAKAKGRAVIVDSDGDFIGTITYDGQPSVIGGWLRRRRKLLELSQHELARLVGVGQNKISNWERGHSIPSEVAKRALEKALKEEGPWHLHPLT